MSEKVLVLGLSKSGISAAKFLKKKGYNVYLTESKSDVDLEKVTELKELGINVEYGEHSENFVSGAVFAVTSPGIPPKAGIMQRLKEKNIPVISEVELAYSNTKTPFIAITGTNGKTTTTANLGSSLALEGKKVVLIDTDIGLRNLDVVMGLENRIVYDIVDVVEEKCKLRQALIKDKRFKELYLLPAAQTRDKSAVNEEQMIELTSKLKEEFDYILIDCPAGIEQGFKNAIAGADRAIVVTTAEISAIRDADRIIGLLESSEIKNPELVINRIRPNMVKKGEMMDVDDIVDLLSIDLIGVVPDDEYIITQTNKGEPVIQNRKAPSGKAYMEIAKRVLGEKIEVTIPGREKGLWQRIKSIFIR